MMSRLFVEKPSVPRMTGDLKMKFSSRLLMLVLFTLLAGCGSAGDDEVKAELSLSEHEHKLLLNPAKFADLDQGFESWWEIVKTTAEAHGVQVEEYVEDYERSRYFAAFYDTEDLQLSKKGFLIRKRTKVKDGRRDDTVKLTLKFKSTDQAEAAAADVRLAAAHDPEREQPEVEADVVNGPGPDSEPSTFYTVKKSLKTDQDPTGTLAEYAAVYPVLATLGVDPAANIVPVNGIEVDVHVVTPGRLDFGNGLTGEVDISVWLIDDQVIGEFSFDHSMEDMDGAPSSSVDRCESFVAHLQKAAPEWCVDGRLKATFVYEK
jgi:hypothetical protein